LDKVVFVVGVGQRVGVLCSVRYVRFHCMTPTQRIIRTEM